MRTSPTSASVHAPAVQRFGDRLIRMRPPRLAMTLAAFAAAFEWLISVTIAPGMPILGGIVAAGGFAVMLIGWRQFRLAKTAICPTDTPTHLVTGGVFRFSRSPMYLGIAAILLGPALYTGSLWHWLSTALFVVVIDRVFCPYEEDRLAREFGDSFERYRQEVRRWL